MIVELQVYAGLKDHFEPHFSLEMPDEAQASDILKRLTELQPAAAELLAACRVAVGDEILSGDGALQPGEAVAVLPPFSGG